MLVCCGHCWRYCVCSLWEILCLLFFLCSNLFEMWESQKKTKLLQSGEEGESQEKEDDDDSDDDNVQVTIGDIKAWSVSEYVGMSTPSSSTFSFKWFHWVVFLSIPVTGKGQVFIVSHFCPSHPSLFREKNACWPSVFSSWNKVNQLQTDSFETACMQSVMGQRSGLRVQNLAALQCAVYEKAVSFFYFSLFSSSLLW